jgi:hypothetical protein
MGAFILWSSSEGVSEHNIRSLFRRKGFEDYRRISSPQWTMLLYPKQLCVSTNYYSFEDWQVISVGTISYKGLSPEKGLKALLQDRVAGKLDWRRTIGAYALFFLTEDHVECHLDPSGLFHLFSNEEGTIVSSSFEAVVCAQDRKHRLNHDAIVEQLVTGFVAPPDTIVHGIQDMAGRTGLRSVGSLVRWQPALELQAQQLCCQKGFSQSVDHQIEVLDNWFSQATGLSSTGAASIGISGGYDSRLLLLLARRAKWDLRLHTFLSEAHVHERQCAEALARAVGMPVTNIPVRTWLAMTPAEALANMADSLYYYDGRTNRTMGSFNDVHTRKTRISALNGCSLGLNGLAGELYRNREHLRFGRMCYEDWFEYFMTDPVLARKLFVRDRIRRRFIAKTSAKYKTLMGVESLKSFNRHAARLFYRNVWIPSCIGPKVTAENQLTSALYPFAEAIITSHSINITPSVGLSGEFEAEMIQRLDPMVAQVKSAYGHPLGSPSLLARVEALLASYTPMNLKRLRATFTSRNRQRNEYTTIEPSALREGVRLLRDLSLPMNLDHLFSNSDHFNRAMYLAFFLHTFKEQFEFSKYEPN